MNRILLIGNGFDLAHGLKTSYQDFIDDYWEKKKILITEELEETWDNDKVYYKYEDETIIFISPCYIPSLPESVNTNKKGCKWFNILLSSKYSITINGYLITVSLEIKNIFLNIITNKSFLKNWVDIEAEYYSLLNECTKGKLNIDDLKKDFSYVKSALINYLQEQGIKRTMTLSKVIDLLDSIISDAKISNEIYDFTKNRILFLVFNYTNTEQYYLDYFKKVVNHSINCIHIHGELENKINPIIFGYGDEIDENYKHIENINDNRFLDNVKYINYLLTDNYKRLLNFINTYEYQVYIMGHSCGISDRTLLNKLFEHQNCKSIKAYYHHRDDGTDDYTNLVQNISRNFNDKSKMREIVVEKTSCIPLI